MSRSKPNVNHLSIVKTDQLNLTHNMFTIKLLISCWVHVGFMGHIQHYHPWSEMTTSPTSLTLQNGSYILKIEVLFTIRLAGSHHPLHCIVLAEYYFYLTQDQSCKSRVDLDGAHFLPWILWYKLAALPNTFFSFLSFDSVQR